MALGFSRELLQKQETKKCRNAPRRIARAWFSVLLLLLRVL